MNNTLSRRLLLSSSAALSVAALAACTTATSGGVTTVTIDVAAISQEGQGIVAVMSAFVAIPAIAALFGANLAVATQAISDASASLVAATSISGGTVSVSVDTASVQAAVTSIVADGTKVLGYVQVALDLLPPASQTQAQNLVASLQTLLPLISLAAALPGLAGARVGALPMTKAQALRIAATAGKG